jgi:hypothetical protein
MVKYKEFKSPTKESVRVVSENTLYISLVHPDWTPLREELWKPAYAEGCISKDMNRIGADPIEAIAAENAKIKAFEARVKEVMVRMVEEGDPEFLDAKGQPKVDAIGYEIGTLPSASLRNRLFKEIENERK